MGRAEEAGITDLQKTVLIFPQKHLSAPLQTDAPNHCPGCGKSLSFQQEDKGVLTSGKSHLFLSSFSQVSIKDFAQISKPLKVLLLSYTNTVPKIDRVLFMIPNTLV